MTTKSHSDKIAEEAVKQLYPNTALPAKSHALAIIKSVIAKAYCLGVDEMMEAGVEAVSQSPAAHASEQVADTKRLDWLQDAAMGLPDFTSLDAILNQRSWTSLREAIDAAMSHAKTN